MKIVRGVIGLTRLVNLFELSNKWPKEYIYQSFTERWPHQEYVFVLLAKLFYEEKATKNEYSMLPSFRTVPVSEHLKQKLNFWDTLFSYR